MGRLPGALFVVDAKKEQHRRRRGEQARHPGGRHRRHQRRSRPHHRADRRQRRRDPLGRADHRGAVRHDHGSPRRRCRCARWPRISRPRPTAPTPAARATADADASGAGPRRKRRPKPEAIAARLKTDADGEGVAEAAAPGAASDDGRVGAADGHRTYPPLLARAGRGAAVLLFTPELDPVGDYDERDDFLEGRQRAPGADRRRHDGLQECAGGGGRRHGEGRRDPPRRRASPRLRSAPARRASRA